MPPVPSGSLLPDEVSEEAQKRYFDNKWNSIMHAKLFCKTGEFAGQRFIVTNEATIGKSAGNTIEISDATISKEHARIYFDEAQQCYFIEDLGSKNGTIVDGVSVKGKERLGKLHVITFAREFDFIFSASDKPAPLDRQSSNRHRQDSRQTSPERQTLIQESKFATPNFNKSPETPDPKQTQFGDGFED